MRVRVNVLVVSPGSEIVRMLGAMLIGDGITVEACVTVGEAMALPPGFVASALVIDSHTPGGDVSKVITAMRAAGHLAAGAPIAVLAERREGPLQREVDAMVGAKLFIKPPSLLDICDLIRAAGVPTAVAAEAELQIEVSDDPDDPPIYFLPGPTPPVSPSPAPKASSPAPSVGVVAATPSTERPSPARSRRPLSGGNARALTRWWARRATGVLCVESTTSAWVLVARGGPVGPDGVSAVEEALMGGEVSLDPCEVDESGDRAAMARLLWRAAREATGSDSSLELIPVANGLTDAASELPLAPATRRCLARLGADMTVRVLARREGAPVDDVAADLSSLRWLGLLALRDPSVHEADIEQPSGGRTPREFTDDARSFAKERPFDVTPDAVSVTRREMPFPLQPVFREPTGGAPTHPSVAPPEPVDDPGTHATSSMVPLARLRREVEILRNADAWTVLGIPRRAALELVRQAATRMKHRYKAMDKDPLAESRDLAAEILARIEAAEAELLSGKSAAAEPAFDGMLRTGLAALAVGEWQRADRTLSSARQHNPDSALALAHLGWARFHNPDHGKVGREEEGVDLIELALQFDINCAQAWRYRGEVASIRGDLEEARQCFSTAAKLDPSLVSIKGR